MIMYLIKMQISYFESVAVVFYHTLKKFRIKTRFSVPNLTTQWLNNSLRTKLNLYLKVGFIHLTVKYIYFLNVLFWYNFKFER